MCSNENIVLFTPNFSLTFTLSPFTFAAHCDQAERSQREPRIKGRRQRRPAALNKRLDVFIVDACMVDNLPVFQIRIRCILVCAVSILLFRSIGCNGTLRFIFYISFRSFPLIHEDLGVYFSFDTCNLNKNSNLIKYISTQVADRLPCILYHSYPCVHSPYKQHFR